MTPHTPPNDLTRRRWRQWPWRWPGISHATGLPIGVNLLRNDGLGALAVAAATGARFIRVNVLVGTMFTDQGPIVGRAHEILRRRAVVAPSVEIWADVMVKHATAPPGLDIRQAAADTVSRGLADGVIVSGPGTGTEPDVDEVGMVRSGIPKETRLVIGSGATPANLRRLTGIADTVIVGSSTMVDGMAGSAVDPIRAGALVEVASELGLV